MEKYYSELRALRVLRDLRGEVGFSQRARQLLTTGRENLDLMQVNLHYGHPDLHRTSSVRLMGGLGSDRTVNKDIFRGYLTQHKLLDPKKFVRFTTQTAIWFNECRVRCRELETLIVKMFREGKIRPDVYKYINRLSSLFFMLGYKSS